MFKNKKKIFSIITTMLVVVSSVCFAATTNSEKAKLEIVENNICTISINDIATFEKKIIDYNLEKKEITLQLKVTNTAEPIFNKPTEIMFVIDNSTSMERKVSTDVTRLKAVTDSAKNLATELLKNDLVKIGIVSFSTGDEEGTITDATLITKPTDVKDTVLDSISSIANGKLGARTNIDAGLTVGNQNFSEDCESKYMVLLTDGLPNVSIGNSKIGYSGTNAENTKAKLNALDNAGVTIFSVMTGVGNETESTTGLTYKKLAEEVFGTTQNPTVGKFYYIDDSEITTTICETVLNDFIDPSINTLTNLKIVDYFPQEIIDNFDFAYVSDPSAGTISPTINVEDNSIVWTIPELEAGESVNVSYKLVLKANIDESILDKVLDTNEKVDIKADEVNDVLSSDVTPKVRVTMEEDITPAPTPIPQTGSIYTPGLVIGIVIIATMAIGIRYYVFSRKMK